jgi:two-component system LytT family response regulator
MPERMEPGTTLGHYSIERRLGEGGMGQVWLARDQRLNRDVAIKVLPPGIAENEDRMSRFVQEARLASSLSHPNIAHIYDTGNERGVAYLVMEYVEGECLNLRLKGAPLNPRESAAIGADIAEALEAAHSRGITHRDIKPANVMITPGGRAKVLDFGLAKITDLERSNTDETHVLTSVGTILGTAQYMSPEQALGRPVDHRSDIYSLGIVLHEMATGGVPVLGVLPMPEPLGSIVRRCLEMEREKRYQSAADLAQDLSIAARTEPDSPSGSRRIRAVIVDDEDLARGIVREYLNSAADVEVVAECSNGFEAVKTIGEIKPDLIFLDVQMPKLDGFEVLELIDKGPAVVFTTAYDSYAMKAFDAHAVDYLLKPFSTQRFETALDRVRQRLRAHAAPVTPPATELAAAARPPHQHAERVVVKDGAKVTIIPVDKLDYVEAQDDYVALHSQKKNYLKQQTISSLETVLDPNQFVRIHRSCIVNIERIAKIEPYTKDSRVAILHDGTRLPVSRAGYARLSALLEGNA